MSESEEKVAAVGDATSTEPGRNLTARYVSSPKIFRLMKVDGERPKIGTAGMMLGVRVPKDIEPDAQGNVLPGTGGMSVRPRLRDIPAVFLPRRLKHINRNAAGNNNLAVWCMGDAPFVHSAVTEDLSLQPDAGAAPDHGVVEPAVSMALAAYQSALESTCDQWVIDEN